MAFGHTKLTDNSAGRGFGLSSNGLSGSEGGCADWTVDPRKTTQPYQPAIAPHPFINSYGSGGVKPGQVNTQQGAVREKKERVLKFTYYFIFILFYNSIRYRYGLIWLFSFTNMQTILNFKTSLHSHSLFLCLN